MNAKPDVKTDANHSTTILSSLPKRITWAELVALEPRLAGLLEACQLTKNEDDWHGPGGLKTVLNSLIGFERVGNPFNPGPEELFTAETYETATRRLIAAIGTAERECNASEVKR